MDTFENFLQYGCDNIHSYIIIGILVVSIIWCFVNFKYLHLNKIIKKTKTDVDKCVSDITKLKEDIDNFNEIVNAIDKRILKIESIIKAEIK